MNISEAFKALGDQPMQEQKLITNGISTIKQYFDDIKARKGIALQEMQAEFREKRLDKNLSVKNEAPTKKMKI